MKEIEWLLQNRSAVAKEPWISVNDCQIPFEQTKKRAAASEEECRRSLISVCIRSGVGYGGERPEGSLRTPGSTHTRFGHKVMRSKTGQNNLT